MATATALPPPHLEYTPHGACRDLFHCQGPEVLLSGPAGTGKSLACLWKLHYCATRVPGLRCLIVRKTRASLTESILVTYERHVLPPLHPALRGAVRANRHGYRYPNGSEIALGGMDLASRVMSSEYDLVYVAEAVELTEADWEALLTRLRNNVLSYQQLLADSNPDTPQHWLKRRCDSGRTILLESRHTDNPTVTAEYLALLDALTGPRKDRLRYGRWVQAEGVVFDNFDRAVDVIDPFPIPKDWPRYWAVDFGFVNPFVCSFWAADPDGRLYLYREVYHTQRLVEDHARRLLHLCGMTRPGDWSKASEPRPRAIICDHDAEGRATLEKHTGLITTPADKSVQEGIQEVAARLRVQGDGRPRLFLFRHCTDERDRNLDAAKKPCCLAEELEGYVWRQDARGVKEEPLKQDDHGLDACRYLVRHLDARPRGVPPDRPAAGSRNIIDRTAAGVPLRDGEP